MRKILYNQDPILKHSICSSFLFSIIGKNEYEDAWINHNFINIRINKSTGYNDFYRDTMWYECPFISENTLTREVIDKCNNNFISFAKWAIDSDFYIYAILNRMYISSYNSPNANLTKNLIIYGYDIDNKYFMAMDFIKGHFEKFIITFDEFKYSYEMKEDKEFYSDYTLYRLVKRRTDKISYNFDVEVFKQKLLDYVNSTNLYKGRSPMNTPDLEEAFLYCDFKEAYDFSFGLEVYKTIQSLYLNRNIDVKAFHLLYEHKQLMIKRINFLFNNKFLNESNYKKLCIDFEDLLHKTLILRNLFLKYKFEFPEKIIFKINEIYILDYQLSMDLINALEG